MSTNPFDDIYQILSDGHLTNGQAVSFPCTFQVPILKAPPALPGHAPAGSSSDREANRPFLSLPLRWSAADLTYLLGAIFPDQTVAGEIVLEQPTVARPAPFSPVRMGLYLRIKSQQLPALPSAFAATAPIGTGRPMSKVLITEAAGATAPAARKALAKAILATGVSLSYITTHHVLMGHLYRLPNPHLRSIKHGIECMAEVSETEWMERLLQLQRVKTDAMPWFEAKLELLLLEGGCDGLAKWARIVDVALGLRDSQRREWAGTYEDVVRFLDIVDADLKGAN